MVLLEHIKAQAWEFRVQYHLGDFILNIEELNKKNIGFKIVPYSEANQYFKYVGLLEYAGLHKGFATYHDGNRLIFYSDALAFSDRNIVIAHEIGHIVLGHTTKNSILGSHNHSNSANRQEQEADVFALALLAPVPVLLEMHVHTISAISQITGLPYDLARLVAIEIAQKDAYKPTALEKKLVHLFNNSIQEYLRYENQHTIPLPPIQKRKRKHTHKRFIITLTTCIISLVSIVVFCVATKKPVSEIPAIAPVIQTPSPIDNYQTQQKETTNDTTSLIVFTTVSGKKYHQQYCRHIKDKTNLTELTIIQAQDRGFAPCKDCFPDTQS